MATKIETGGGYQAGYDDGNSAGSASGSSTRAGKLHFPDGWSLHATALGESFPGFGSNVIPVAMNGKSRTYYWGRNNGSHTESINGVAAYGFNYNCHDPATEGSEGSSYAYNLFLPAFFGFDWTAIQNNIKSGTITVWLTRD